MSRLGTDGSRSTDDLIALDRDHFLHLWQVFDTYRHDGPLPIESPPLVITREEVDIVVSKLRDAIVAARADLQRDGHTPRTNAAGSSAAPGDGIGCESADHPRNPSLSAS